MKIEFLNDNNDGGRFPQVVSNRLVRLYDFESSQARILTEVIQQTVIEEKKEFNFAMLDFIQPINCSLTLKISNIDEGIASIDNHNFHCSLTIGGYQDMVFMMEPFCNKEINGYQWLYNVDTAIGFLFSPGGWW